MNLTETYIKHIERTLGASIDGVSLQNLPVATLAELSIINNLVINGVILATEVGIIEVDGRKSIRISLEGINKLLKFNAQFDRTANAYQTSYSAIRTGVLQA